MYISLRVCVQVGHRTHFVESPSLYSLVDLIDTHTGALSTELDRILGLFSSHIKLKCPVRSSPLHLNCIRGHGHVHCVT